jgi:hypothetical protein
MRQFVPIVILAVVPVYVAVRLRQRGRIGGIGSLLAQRRRASGKAGDAPPVLGVVARADGCGFARSSPAGRHSGSAEGRLTRGGDGRWWPGRG